MKLCNKKTVPYDFDECHDTYSKEGLRIIGVGSKEITEDQIGL